MNRRGLLKLLAGLPFIPKAIEAAADVRAVAEVAAANMMPCDFGCNSACEWNPTCEVHAYPFRPEDVV